MIWYIYGLMGLILAKSTLDWYRYERPGTARKKRKVTRRGAGRRC